MRGGLGCLIGRNGSQISRFADLGSDHRRSVKAQYLVPLPAATFGDVLNVAVSQPCCCVAPVAYRIRILALEVLRGEIEELK